MDLRNRLSEYLIEFIIIVLGITLSFILNEWRNNRDNRAAEIEALQAIHADLIADSTTVGKEIKLSNSYEKYYGYFLQNIKNKNAKQDSIVQALNVFGNYTTFEIRNVNFQQLQATGQLRLISNKKILTQIVNLYANEYENIKEYVHIDRVMVLEQILPFLIKESNLSLYKLYARKDILKLKEYKNLLNDKAFQNLFLMNQVFKFQTIQRYVALKKLIGEVIKAIEAELNKLQ